MAGIRIILHGKAAGDARVRTAVHDLRLDGHLVEVRVTWEPGDAARLTTAAVAEAGAAAKINSIVAGGGDGTINEVFAAAYAAGLPAGCSLGILPLGTANDFAHSASIPLEDPTAALQLAERPAALDRYGASQRQAVHKPCHRRFRLTVTVETDPELKRRLGRLAYLLTGISHFPELSANHGSFRAEDFSWEGRFVAVAIGNGRQAGGGVPLCPDALVDDGLLDLMILPELDRAARLDAFSRLLREGAAAIRAELVTN